MLSSTEKITINGTTIFVEVHSGYVILYTPQKQQSLDYRFGMVQRFRFKRTPTSGWVIQGCPLWNFLDRCNLRNSDLKTLDRKLDAILQVEIFSIFEVE